MFFFIIPFKYAKIFFYRYHFIKAILDAGQLFLDLFSLGDKVDVALVKLLPALVKLFKRLRGNEFGFSKPPQLNRLLGRVPQNSHLYLLYRFGVGLFDFEIIQPVQHVVFGLVKQQVLHNLAHIVVQQIDFLLSYTNHKIRTCKPIHPRELL